jgi:hypothetical protein
MKRIPLTQGKFALVDDEDYEWLNQYSWYAVWDTTARTYKAARTAACSVGNKRKTILMHREIMSAPHGVVVDHIRHNTLDNRKSELRICAHKFNCRNRLLSKNNTSGYKGVTWFHRFSCWRANITIDRKQIFLGHFRSAELAAAAYDEASQKLHGHFASPNHQQESNG